MVPATPSLHRSHGAIISRGAIISHQHALMATQLQKPFFCPLEPRAEDDDGSAAERDSEIERRQRTLLRAARAPSAPAQLGI